MALEESRKDNRALMQQLDETFREVRKLILSEWNKQNPYGLGFSHGRLLIILHEQGPQKPSVLADCLTMSGGGVTGIADRLIELGFVSRERSERDRRMVLLQLTAEGEAIVEQIHATRGALMLKMFRGMTPLEMEKALKLFVLMKRNLESTDE
ncbi:MarR family transcriptional regulator [Paenibacillus sp. J5C2022]|uniref:MarR family transcriptional regulator n=1 Tax=Paenibacillus sp. J5C2022 TaxID=2977129 RepID=UPI0021D1EBAD|nr:MarR family transcriptional regulator [Paenibacillus sp. J5C2022]